MRGVPGEPIMKRWLVGGIVAGACIVVWGGPAGSGSNPKPWTQIEELGPCTLVGEVAQDKDLSGLAFISDRFGLLGADEARQVQVVELSRQARTLRVVETISLLRSGSEIDIEAIAAEADCYYIIGSHGVAKGTGVHQDNRYRIFRLKVDAATGRPQTLPGAREPVGLETASLAEVLRADPVLGPHFGKPLQRRGVNIEGLAARQGRLYVGFRAPNLGGEAFVMEIRADDVFSGKPQPAYTLHRLRLGAGLGIRELTATRSSFLIIAGNAGSEPSAEYAQSEDYDKKRDFFLFRWDGTEAAVRKIGALPKTDGQPEALAVLEETKDSLTVLILFDGPKGGRPTLYRIS